MGKTLSKYTNSRDNNFNLIRFIAASLVLYYHSFPLAGISGEPFSKYLGISSGTIAVDVFFICSGFLVSRSFFERNNIIAFTWARILRIYPALIVAVLFCTLIVGLFFTQEWWFSYLMDSNTHKFFLKNITLFFGVEYTLPSVFTNNPFPNAVNGSLWTLPYEVKMYAYLAIIATFLNYLQKLVGGKFIKLIFLFIAIFSLAAHITNHFQLFTSDNFIRLFSMFFVGVAFYLYRDNIYMSLKLFLFIFTILLISIFNKESFFIIYSISLSYLIFYVAYVPSGVIRKFNKFGDYSYGMYIYAFPVQQSIAAMIPNVSFIAMVSISFFITLLLSFLSWNLIEKKLLKMKGSHVVFESMLKNIHLT